MTERPILFSGPMVRAILEGRKSQTRRILKILGHKSFSEFGPSDTPGYDWHFRDAQMRWHDLRDAELRARLKYAPGDRLWVRETFSYDRLDVDRDGILPPWYWADGNPDNGDWSRPKPSIHMPRWASRLTLIVTDVRVQRLQDISEADAVAEGAAPQEFVCCNSRKPARYTARQVFVRIWSDIHGNDSVLHGPNAWDANPWVCAVTFTAHRQNIDQMEASHD